MLSVPLSHPGLCEKGMGFDSFEAGKRLTNNALTTYGDYGTET
jgi:hypothetical protein